MAVKVDGELGSKKSVRSALVSRARGDANGRAREAGRERFACEWQNDVRVMNAALPAHKTKIVATIGPASESPEMLVRLIRAGINVARLNFSHGNLSKHAEVIRRIRDAARETGRRVAIMADLPGPKMRLGKIDPEPIQLLPGAHFTLTSQDIVGNAQRVSMSFAPLPRVVKPGDKIFLNDGLVQLMVERVVGNDVECTVVVGGELRSRKGLNLPGVDLGISAFTENDRACLEFALKEGVDAVSQSFVERAADIEAVRGAAAKIGAQPFVIAKIERADALAHFDEILAASDGIMVARGDLGVEVPIEEIAYTQKQLIAKANLAGKPVITATQMLESMVSSRLPRAPRQLTSRTRFSMAPIASCSLASRRWGTFPRKQSRCWRRSPRSPKHIDLPGALRFNATSCSRRQRLGPRSYGVPGRARTGHGAMRSGARADAWRHGGARDLAI